MNAAAKLQIISGKGGVGKSLVATAIASQHARGGARTLLVSFEQSSITHPYLELVPSYVPRQAAPNLWLSRVDAHQALSEYVRRKVNFSVLYEGLLANPVTTRFLDALPLFHELMSLGKLYDFTTHSASNFDRVVFDAPATGHCKILLNVPAVASTTLIAGPVHRGAVQILNMLRDPQLTELVLVTLPEETPVREALELQRFATQEANIACRQVWVNRLVSDLVSGEVRAAVRESAVSVADLEPVAQTLQLAHRVSSHQQEQLLELKQASLVLKPIADHLGSGPALLAAVLAESAEMHVA